MKPFILLSASFVLIGASFDFYLSTKEKQKPNPRPAFRCRAPQLRDYSEPRVHLQNSK